MTAFSFYLRFTQCDNFFRIGLVYCLYLLIKGKYSKYLIKRNSNVSCDRRIYFLLISNEWNILALLSGAVMSFPGVHLTVTKLAASDINTKWAILCLCCFLSSYDPNCSQNPYCSSVRCVVVDVCSLCNQNCGLCRIAAPKIHVRKSIQSSLVNLKFHIIDIVLNSIVTRTVDPSSANAVSYLLQCYVTKAAAKVGTLPPTGLTVFQT